MKAQVGDVITAKGKVISVVDDGPVCAFNLSRPEGMKTAALVCVAWADVVGVEPRPIKVGDKVLFRDAGMICGPVEVIAIHRERVWLWNGSADRYLIRSLSDLQRAGDE